MGTLLQHLLRKAKIFLGKV